ncbi:putative beta-carotene-binding protein isoform X2 [Trichoplusia ni]|uniref:Beta-carotene-binding protein isoform X2 n=1 Tax=Trichoplusia ni TaxID=7111 RepID=A0A7E5WW85_TRINI|nr:putative beta-carotene-binding protein isoform X2 [Trichoplusia ni]
MNHSQSKLTALSLAEAQDLSFITSCKAEDSKCHKQSTQQAIPVFAAGIPELNVEQLDPMYMKHIDANQSNLMLVITDTTITGLKDCEAKRVQREPDNSKLYIRMLCDCELHGQYEMNGQMFLLPIKGEGPLSAKINKLYIAVDADLGEEVREGNTYWTLNSFTHSFELKGTSEVNFGNLFPDNELLRKTANDLISRNGNDVVREIGGPVIVAAITKVVKNVENFFQIVPADKLTL